MRCVPSKLHDATTAAFRLAARLRRARAFHPVGAAFRATVDVHDPRAEPALRPGPHPAVVRFSRGIGWRRGLPDIQGVALRLLDADGPGRHQDLLLASVASAGVGRVLPWLATTLSGPFFATVAPYQAPAGRTVVGARFTSGDRFTLAGVEDAVWSGRCRLALLAAAGLGPWQEVATVAVHADRLTDDEERDLGFDPWNTADGFTPVGWLNRLRRPAYPASREGRRGGRRGAAGSARR